MGDYVSRKLSRFENSRKVKMTVIRVLLRHLQHATSTFSEFRKRGEDGNRYEVAKNNLEGSS